MQFSVPSRAFTKLSAAAAAVGALLLPAVVASPAQALPQIPCEQLAIGGFGTAGCGGGGGGGGGGTPTPPASTDYVFTPAALPWNPGAIGLCIGGGHCGGTRGIVIKTQGQYVSTVQLYAHDDLWDKTEATMRLYADGVLLGAQDVKKAGSWLTFTVYRPVTTLKLTTSTLSGGWSDEAYVAALAVN